MPHLQNKNFKQRRKEQKYGKMTENFIQLMPNIKPRPRELREHQTELMSKVKTIISPHNKVYYFQIKLKHLGYRETKIRIHSALLRSHENKERVE